MLVFGEIQAHHGRIGGFPRWLKFEPTPGVVFSLIICHIAHKKMSGGTITVGQGLGKSILPK
jgi:hypothetical protein